MAETYATENSINKPQESKRSLPAELQEIKLTCSSSGGYVPPAYNRDILVGQREEIQQHLDKRVGVEIRELEPDEKAAVKEAVRDDVDRNPFAGKSKEELDKIRGERKDLSPSQNYNMMQLKNYRKEQEEKANIPKTEQEFKPEPGQEKQSVRPLASERFSRSLNYTRAVESGREMTEKVPQKSVEKDDR